MRSALSPSCFAILALALVLPCDAQVRSEVVVPTGLAAAEGNSMTQWAALSVDARRQLLVDARHLGPHAGEDIVALRLRRDGEERSTLAGRVWIDVWLSNSPRAAEQAMPAFSGNRGPDEVMVFSGYVSLPALGAPTLAPAPWTSPWAVTFALSRPFRWTGGTLCIETRTLRTVTKDSTNKPEPPWFVFDAERRSPTGSSKRFGQSCIPGMLVDAAGAPNANQAVGTTVAFNLQGQRSTGVALLLLGAERLDIRLDLAGAPGCRLYTQPLLLQPSAITALPGGPIGLTTQALPVPVAPSLVGVRLYTQWMVVDRGANSLGLTFSNGVESVLGSPIGLGVAWVESYTPEATAGQILTDRTPVVQVTFEQR